MERNISVWFLLAHPTLGNLACNPDICPDWKLNRPSGLQADARSTEPHQPGPVTCFYFIFYQGLCHNLFLI